MTGIVEMNVLASVFIIFVILFRSVLLCRLPKRCFTVLWLIAALRLLIPFSLQINYYTTESQQVSEKVYDRTMQNIYKSQIIIREIDHIINSSDFFCLIHIIGTASAFSSFIAVHFYGKKNYSDALPYEYDTEEINQIVFRDKLKRKLIIKTSDKISAPFTSGIIRPIIFIPKTILKETNKYTRFVISHELIHIHYFDVLYKWIIIIAACVNWFNPFIWIMLILADNDIEYACDESVIKKYPDSKIEYAEALIAFEEHRSNINVSNYFSKNIAEKRIYVIIKSMKMQFSEIIAALFISVSIINLFITSSDNSLTYWEGDSKKNYIYQKQDSSFNIVTDNINDYQLSVYAIDPMNHTSKNINQLHYYKSSKQLIRESIIFASTS